MERAKATASFNSAARMGSSKWGAGAISITFWWRRCTEQSRSKRCIVSPVPSAIIWTSMCLGRITACSKNIRPSPKAVSASRMAASRASRNASGLSTRRIPRPPPPATALAKIGKPIPSAAARRASISVVASLEANTGTPAAIAYSFAVTLLPAISNTDAGGPMKTIPSSSQARAKSGFSLRNPYPG